MAASMAPVLTDTTILSAEVEVGQESDVTIE